jgi:tRNA A-37 threonylcarbamoyl transferase component Bud32
MYTNGRFGCVYYPIITKNKLSKQQTNKRYSVVKKVSQNEIRVQRLLKTIPDYSLFFHTFLTCEQMHIGRMEEDEITNDEITNDKIKNTMSMITYEIFPYKSLKEYLQSNKSETAYIYESLYKSIKLMNKYGIIHQNICEENIIVCEHNGFPMITSFEHAIIYNNFQPVQLYKGRYCSLSMFVILYLQENKLTNLSISNVYQIFKEYSEYFPALLDESSSILFLKKYTNKPSEKVIDELMRNYSSTWDGIALLQIWSNILV